MTGEVTGDVTGDVIGDVISEANALTVRRALLSAPGGAPPPSPCAIWFRFRQNFRTEGEHPGRTASHRGNTTEYIRVHGGKAEQQR